MKGLRDTAFPSYKDFYQLLIIMNNITITNSKIIDFFNTHPDIEVDSFILHFIELYDNLFNSTNLTTSVSNQLLNQIASLKENLDNYKSIYGVNYNSIKSDMYTIKEYVSNLNYHFDNLLTSKLYELRNTHLNDIKELFNHNNSENKLYLIDNLGKTNNEFLTKITNTLHEFIPKNSENISREISKDINDHFRTFYSDINNVLTTDNREILNAVKMNISQYGSLETYSKSIDDTITKLMQHFQQGLYTYVGNSLSNSEERIRNNIFNLSKDIDNIKNNFSNTEKNLEEVLNKFRNSSYKGQLGEKILFNILTKLYPTGEIIDKTGDSKSADFILKRTDKPNILFENKDYNSNVNPDEVKKFIRDIDENNCSGIFLSQHTGITSKSNWQIDISKNNILLYIHCVEYDPEKIKTAVDIIDHLSNFLDNHVNANEIYHLSEETLNEINTEYQTFILEKERIVGYIKEFTKNMVNNLENLKLPNIEHMLKTKFGTINKCEYKCTSCNNWIGKSAKALSIHMHHCKKKQEIIVNNDDNI